MLAPFADARRRHRRRPAVVASGHRPAHPRVHRPAHHGGDPRASASTSASPRTSRQQPSPTSSCAREPDADRLEEDIARAGRPTSRARRPRRLRPAAAVGRRADRRRGSRRSGWPRRRAPTTSSTSSCPRAAIADLMTRCRSWPRGPARSSPAAATPVTATSTCRSSSPTPRSGPQVITRSVRDSACALGGAISGEHGIGDREALLPRSRGPGQGGPDAAHQGGLRPQRHPQPRHALRL